jgi:hypothetical protein
LQAERWYDLIVILDDATREICYAQLGEEESSRAVLAGLKEVNTSLCKLSHFLRSLLALE